MVERTSLYDPGTAPGDTFGPFEFTTEGWVKAVPLPASAKAADADVTAGAADKWVDAEHLKTALDALNLTGELVGTSATFAAIPAVPADASAEVKYHAWLSADEIGTGTAEAPQYPKGVYVPDATFSTWELAVAVSGEALPGIIPDATILPTAPDYSTIYSYSNEKLDEYGRSRRVRRIFDDPGPFDYTALSYADRTALFIRNPDPVNGMSITYGTGGAVTLHVTFANGVKQTISGQDVFSNLQPGEFAVFEKDGNEARLDIVTGERVTYYNDYAQASNLAPSQVAFDGIVVIRDTEEIWCRKSNSNSAAFPADGMVNADWFKIAGRSKEIDIPDWMANTAYAVGDEVIAPMPINADFISDAGAIVGVNYIFKALQARPDTITAFDDVEADGGFWELVGAFRSSGTSVRAMTGTGTMYFNPLDSLSNTASSEFMLWTTAGTAQDIYFGFDPVFITRWSDYTGLGLTPPAAQNTTWTLPENSSMLVTRSGNAISIILEKFGAAPSGGILEAETVAAAANAFVITADRVTTLEATGVTAGDVVTMPDLTNFGGADSYRRGQIVNRSGVNLTLGLNGNTSDSLVTELRAGYIYDWRQTAASQFVLWEVGRLEETVVTTTQTLGVIHEWEGNASAANEATIDFGADLTGAEWALMWFDNSGATGYSTPYVVPMVQPLSDPNAPILVDGYANGHADIDQVNLAAGTIRFRAVSLGNLQKVIFYGHVDNAVVRAVGQEFMTMRPLAVTSPTATPNISIAEETAGRYKVNVTPGSRLVLGAVSGANLTLEDPVNGWIIAQATGSNPTVTFTEEVTSLPVVVNLVNNAGEWFATGVDGIEMHMGSANDRQGYLRFTNRVAVIAGQSWYSQTPTGNAVGRLPRFATLSLNETVRWWEDAGFNFVNVGQTQFFRFKNLVTDTEYEIEYTVQSNHLNNLVKVTRF